MAGGTVSRNTLKKATQEDDALLKQLQSMAPSIEEKEEQTPQTETTNKEPLKKKPLSKRPNVSICVNPEEKDSWLEFFQSYGCSLAHGIRRAVNYYIKQVKAGKIEL